MHSRTGNDSNPRGHSTGRRSNHAVLYLCLYGERVCSPRRGASLRRYSPDTLNIDETKIEAAITPRTKVIAPVHYAGVACEMDTIMAIARGTT